MQICLIPTRCVRGIPRGEGPSERTGLVFWTILKFTTERSWLLKKASGSTRPFPAAQASILKALPVCPPPFRGEEAAQDGGTAVREEDRKSTRLNSSHVEI